MTIIMRPYSAHWGAFSAGFQDGELVVSPYPSDPDPPPATTVNTALGGVEVERWDGAVPAIHAFDGMPG